MSELLWLGPVPKPETEPKTPKITLPDRDNSGFTGEVIVSSGGEKDGDIFGTDGYISGEDA